MENLSKMRLSLLPKQLNYESIEIPTELKLFVEEDLPHLIGAIKMNLWMAVLSEFEQLEGVASISSTGPLLIAAGLYLLQPHLQPLS
jgi:hypothetical protein